MDNLASFANIKKGENKRAQVFKSPPEESKPAKSRAIKKTPASRSKKTKNEPYVSTHLQLPESLKLELDMLFLKRPDLRRKGKNNWLIEQVEAGIKHEAKAPKLP